MVARPQKRPKRSAPKRATTQRKPKRANPRRPTPPIAEDIGRRVEYFRKANGMTQETLAWNMDLAKSAVNRIESGQRLPGIEVLAGLAKHLGVEPRDLLVFPERSLVDEAIEAVRIGGSDFARRVLTLSNR